MDKLELLAEKIKLCINCPLREGATQPVPGIGEIGAKYMLIGEAPGAEEDRSGMPFVGSAGKKLNQLLELAGISQGDCYFTNVCRCRPPSNRTPKKAEIRSCTPFLEEEIQVVRPEYIITLGATPLSLFSPNGIRQMHGTLFSYEFKEKK